MREKDCPSQRDRVNRLLGVREGTLRDSRLNRATMSPNCPSCPYLLYLTPGDSLAGQLDPSLFLPYFILPAPFLLFLLSQRTYIPDLV